MNKIFKILKVYLAIGFPFVLGTLIWNLSMAHHPSLGAHMNGIIMDIVGWNMFIWFFSCILFLGVLVIVPRAREKTLRRLANIKERDEREQFITGKAARVTYMANLSLMIFLLFCTLTSINVYRFPEGKSYKGHHHNVCFGITMQLLEKNPIQTTSKDTFLFGTESFKPTKTSIILLLIVWQFIIFNFIARKEQVKGLH